MPWCDSCSEYRAPTALDAGKCATCGGEVTGSSSDDVETRTVGQSAPWHFWIVVVALAGYLLWRLVDLIRWLLS